MIVELEDKGFVGTNFRRDAAYVITDIANEKTPVPDDLVARMERWLVPNTNEGSNETGTDPKNNLSPVLWGHRSIAVLPSGNYPTLMALTSACLTAEPPRLDRWLSILERHIARDKSPQVWDALAQHALVSLRMVDRSRAEALVDQLIASEPSIVVGRGWALFVADAFDWASATAARRWLYGIVERGGEGLQGAGELACLRFALFPAEDWARELVGILCKDAGFSGGSGSGAQRGQFVARTKNQAGGPSRLASTPAQQR